MLTTTSSYKGSVKLDDDDDDGDDGYHARQHIWINPGYADDEDGDVLTTGSGDKGQSETGCCTK